MLAPPVGRALDTGFQDGAELFSELAKGWSGTRSPAPLFKAAPGAGCCWAGGLSDVHWAWFCIGADRAGEAAAGRGTAWACTAAAAGLAGCWLGGCSEMFQRDLHEIFSRLKSFPESQNSGISVVSRVDWCHAYESAARKSCWRSWRFVQVCTQVPSPELQRQLAGDFPPFFTQHTWKHRRWAQLGRAQSAELADSWPAAAAACCGHAPSRWEEASVPALAAVAVAEPTWQWRPGGRGLCWRCSPLPWQSPGTANQLISCQDFATCTEPAVCPRIAT